jgi:hypothetical protein
MIIAFNETEKREEERETERQRETMIRKLILEMPIQFHSWYSVINYFQAVSTLGFIERDTRSACVPERRETRRP